MITISSTGFGSVAIDLAACNARTTGFNFGGLRMAFVQRISQGDATGQLKEDFDFLSGSYGRNLGPDQIIPCPQVYTTSTLLPAYFHFGAVQNAALTNDGHGAAETGPVPHILINFGVSDASSCFY